MPKKIWMVYCSDENFLSEFVYTVRSVDRGRAILSCMISG